MLIVRQTRGQVDEQEHPCQSGRGPGQQPHITSNGSMMPGFAANHYCQHQPRTCKKRQPSILFDKRWNDQGGPSDKTAERGHLVRAHCWSSRMHMRSAEVESGSKKGRGKMQ